MAAAKVDKSLDEIIKDKDGGGPRGDQKCFTCNKTGHFARNCPEKQQQQARGTDEKCFNCGKRGHFARDCRSARGGGDRCYNCGQGGHIAKNCKAEVKDACYNCGKSGHFARDCTAAPQAGAGAGAQSRRARSRSPKQQEAGEEADYDPATCVFVNKLSFDTTWQNMKDHFRKCGEVVHADIYTKANGFSKGSGYVQFESAKEAQKAIKELHESELDGRKIYVREYYDE